MIDAVVFPCTYKCDGKCIMCTIHERVSCDVPWEDFQDFFRLPEIQNIKSINITGGEPTLRTDIEQLISMICRTCQSLKELIINTNGINKVRIIEVIKKLLVIIPKNIQVWIYVSLDALDERADIVRGIKGVSKKVLSTLEELICLQKKYDFGVGLTFTATRENYTAMQDVYKYAMERKLYFNCVLSTLNYSYINSSKSKVDFLLSKEQEKVVLRQLEEMALEYDKVSFTPDFWGDKENILHECIFRQKRGLLLEPDGTLRVCGMIENGICGGIYNLPILEYKEDSLPSCETCKNCKTDSYYILTKAGQDALSKAMLEKVKKVRIKKTK